MTDVLERMYESTEIPMLSGDYDRLSLALAGDDPAGVWVGATSLPLTVVIDEYVRSFAPTASEFRVDWRPLIIDTSLARHLLLRETKPNKGVTLQWIVDLLRVAPSVVESEEDLEVTAAGVIEEVIKETALSQEKVADILGVTRGTLHNWRKKHRVSTSVDAERVLALHRGVMRLRQNFGRATTASWLTAGSPSPASFLQQDDLPGFETPVDQLLAPVATPAPSGDEAAAGEAPDFSGLAAFLVSPLAPVLSVVRSVWRPVEDTGLGSPSPLGEEEED